MADRWIGIDVGYSQMRVAVLDAGGRTLAFENTYEPYGDGHDREVALARLRRLLKRLSSYKDVPVFLAGYCYEHSGVLELFREEGWTVEGYKGLNDVVGIYGLTEMKGHALVCGCGSFSQRVYVGRSNDIYWPGEDVVPKLPGWLLSGWDYAVFLLDLSKRAEGDLKWLAREVRKILGGDRLESSGHRWGALGPFIGRLIGHPELKRYLKKAAKSVIETRDVFWQHLDTEEPPALILGGGALGDENLWLLLEAELRELGAEAPVRVQGEPAVGLARYALYHPDADPWRYIGQECPSWLR